MSKHELEPFSTWCASVAKEAGKATYQVAEGVLVLAACAISPLIYVLGAFYFLCIEGRSNCLVWAVGQKLRHWRITQIIWVKNSRGRSHWQLLVRPNGHVYEWYAKGASQRSRLANLWYRGEMKKVGNR